MLFKLYRIKGEFKFTRKNAKDSKYCTGCPYIINLDHKCIVDSNSIEGTICFSEFMKWGYRKRGVIVYHPSQRYDT
jgi:hypothetical protein